MEGPDSYIPNETHGKRECPAAAKDTLSTKELLCAHSKNNTALQNYEGEKSHWDQ